jgi:hypothetical protein
MRVNRQTVPRMTGERIHVREIRPFFAVDRSTTGLRD